MYRFRFVSVLLEHLYSHVSNVEKIATMKMNIWVSKRNLKCTQERIPMIDIDRIRNTLKDPGTPESEIPPQANL